MPEEPARSGRTRDRPLSREEIVDAAVRLLRDRGSQALAITQVAKDLGVSAAAVYYYIPGKAELVDAVVDAVVSTIRLPGREVGAWDDRLHALADDFSAVLSEYRGLGMLLAVNPVLPALLRLTKFCVEVLGEAGFSPAEAVRATALLWTFTMGEIVGGAPAGPRATRRLQIAPNITTGYPELGELAERFAALDAREVYVHGIDLLIVGLKAELATRASGIGSPS